MKTALSNFEGFRSIRVDVPKRTAIGLVVDAMKPPTLVVDAAPAVNLDVIADRIRSAFRARAVPDNSDMRHAPWCIWDGARPLERDPDVLSAYLAYVGLRKRKSQFRRLAAAYVVRFPTKSGILATVAALLRELAEEFSGPWSTASRALAIFDPTEAPARIASAARWKRVSPTEVLIDHGLSGLATESGLAEASFVAGLRQIRSERMDPLDRLESINQWCPPRAGRGRFWEHRGLIADALLLPNVDGIPDRTTKDKMLSFLIQRFQDPRLHEINWNPMECTSIAKRWLIEQSLRQFLDVVDVIALERHWKHRRAFWSAVYGKGLISDACVVFDQLGAEHANKIFEGKTPFSRWAAGGSKPIERGHACLLLHIGRGVVAEWSHNGRCNIWRDATAPTAPKLHQRLYTSTAVMVGRGTSEERKGQIAIPHMGAESYSWQSKVADEIHVMTSVRVMQSEYVVR